MRPDFTELLKRLRLKVTPKRLAILDIMHVADTYLSPEEVQIALQQRHATIGLPTVYRNLDDLAAGGIISRILLPNRQLYYYFCPNAGHHHHFVCLLCRRVVDIDDCGCETLPRHVAGEVHSHIIQFLGHCQACLSRGAAQI